MLILFQFIKVILHLNFSIFEIKLGVTINEIMKPIIIPKIKPLKNPSKPGVIVKNKTPLISSKLLAVIAVFISLTGGIPGTISSWNQVLGKPKLNLLLSNTYSGEIRVNSQKPKNFIYLFLTIGNIGTVNFKRFGNPKIEVKIRNNWIELNPYATNYKMIENINDEKTRNFIREMNIQDYYMNNNLITPNESIRVFLFADIDTNTVTLDEINNANQFKITLKDVNLKKYSYILKR